jgi:hypothetical protein
MTRLSVLSLLTLPSVIPLAPRIGESGKHSSLVASDPPDKTAQFWYSAADGLFDPGIERLRVPCPDHLGEGLGEQTGHGDFWMCLQDQVSLASLLL